MCVSMYLLRCTRWHVGWSFPWTSWISCWNMKITTPVLERQSSCYNKKRCAAPGQLGTWTRNRHNWKGLQQSNYTLVNFESTDVATMSLRYRYWNFPFPPLLSAAQKRGALGRDSAGAWPWRSSSLCLQGYSIVRHLLSSHDNRCRFCRPLGGFKRDFHPKQVPLAQQRKETVVTGFFSSGEGLWSL